MPTFDRIADLPLDLDEVEIEALPAEPVSGIDYTRHSTVVRLRGGGHEGIGEDVSYEEELHEALRAGGPPALPKGRTTFAEFSDALPELPGFRRWAVESAALDLALRQARRSLAAALGREARPVTFVRSGRLSPEWRALYPDLRMKLDASDAWDETTIEEVRASGVVDVVDLKGLYEGDWLDATPGERLYRLVADGLPDVWIEDPKLDDETIPVLEPHRDRVTWDAALHAPEDLDGLRWEPRCVNSKPSRFGSVRAVLTFLDVCAERGIAVYGGGQSELGPGRGQIQHLASLFHPDGPNDVAPIAYNRAPVPGLPVSPLPPPPDVPGFR